MGGLERTQLHFLSMYSVGVDDLGFRILVNPERKMLVTFSPVFAKRKVGDPVVSGGSKRRQQQGQNEQDPRPSDGCHSQVTSLVGDF
jgi:hypothetical protein